MKRLFAPLVIGFALLVVSCASTPKTVPVFDTTVESEKNSNLATIIVTPKWQPKKLTMILEGIGGFRVEIKNNADKIIRVVWEKSSLTYGGRSYTPFLEGQRFIEASTPATPTVIPSKGMITKQVYSSGQPHFAEGKYGGWQMYPIQADNVVMILCVESGDIEEYYTVTVKRFL